MGGSSKPKMIVTRYYLSGHWGICQTADAVRDIRIGEKIIWKGMARNNGTVNIAREGLFGGMKKEGGAKGGIDIMLGRDNQVPPKSLISRLRIAAANVPGFRGITSLMFHGGAFWDGDVYGDPVGGDGGSDYGESRTIFGMATSVFARLAYRNSAFYWGTQPYLKPLWVTVQRIPVRELHSGTAEIPRLSDNPDWAAFYEGFEAGLDGYLSYEDFGNVNDPADPFSYFDVVDGYLGAGLRVGPIPANAYTTHPSVYKALQVVAPLTRVECKMRLDQLEADDSGWLVLRDANGNSVFNVSAGRDSGVDALQRPTVSFIYAAGNLGTALGSGPLEIGVWYTFVAEFNPATQTFTARIVRTDTGAEFGSMQVQVPEPLPVSTVHIESDASVSRAAGASTWDEIHVLTGTPVVDANPAHVIYECLTDTDWGMGASPGDLDTASFQSASVRLFEEDFGIAMAWMAQSSIEDFVNDVLAHIQGAIFPHPRSGKITLKLLRDDLDLDSLKTITPDNANLRSFSRKGWGETVNEVVVTWTNPITEKEETVYAQDLANIAQQGGVVSSSKNYHGVRTATLASRLAERDLREESAPLCACEVEVNREFWDVTPFEGIKVTWPEYGLDELVMRVMKVNYGDSASSTIRLSLVEDVFSLPLASYIAPVTGEWQDPSVPPVPVSAARLMPPPAWVSARLGIGLDTLIHSDTGIVPLAVNPTTAEGATYDVLRETTTASGEVQWEQELGDVPFPATAELPAELPAEVTTTGLLLAGMLGEPPMTEDMLLIGDDDLPDEALELALVVATDPETGGLTLRRGVLDTVPRAWPAGTRVAVTREFHWRPLPRTFLDGQSVTLKFLVSTPGGMLEEYEAPAFTGLAVARPTLPTRPANLRVFGDLYPDPDHYPEYPVTITWSHRNRLLEDSVMLAWDETGIPVEAAVEFRVRVEAIQEDGTVDGTVADVTQAGTSYELPEGAIPAGLMGSPFMRATVTARRDGLDSWQSPSIRFRGPLRPPQIIWVEASLFAPEIIDVEPT
ncbi:phage tail protein [Halomonas sp. JS92-SW72]|uniref:phage tail protein n=1 Tax=Halomonas sp. JS92-SW72 TaxID=2306583 RepID=UPI000E5A2675|nr:phage tail protein [Halomonas sp. JS92-SW72]AXY41590.1 hypothetical protein D1793_04920 [Halomonas sp. JS92-SW72]